MIIIYSINKSRLKINIRKYMKKLTLHTLGEITQVEEIVGLGWSGKQISFHAAIDFNSCPYNWLYWLTHCLREVSKETIQNGLKQTNKKKNIARDGEKNLCIYETLNIFMPQEAGLDWWTTKRGNLIKAN